ncbi:MAG: 2-dehydropantoate 2-reductase [SAR202 cluster bacterium]|nr:2-dehydropantoate 2-reductase [SAR202 cluster bacterium]
MLIAVMGAGSIGAYFGGKLALAGNTVTLVARGAHLDAIRRRGLRLLSDGQETLVACPAQVRATDDPKSVGPADLVLLTVKTYHNPGAVPAMRPMVGESTAVLCLQNGVDSYEAASRAFGAARVLPGAAYVEASLPAPGVVQQTGDVVRIVFGEADNQDSARGRKIQEVLEAAGIPAQFTTSIHRTLWTKFLFIATLVGVTCLARQSLAELWPRPEWRQVIEGCLRELEAVGRACGVDLDADVVAQTLAYMESSVADLSASMYADLLAGRPLELEALNGAAVRAGKRAGVATPMNDVIYAMLKPYAEGVGR